MSGESSPREIMKFSESDVSLKFDDATQNAIDEIAGCQTEINQLDMNASDEIVAVEQNFNQLQKPLFEKRNLMISNIPNFSITAVSFSVTI
ncbi:hypothetical protein JTB14_016776 [Gonioctena quinquepunctata]|nr:hypothetical protein JTB14_016776 [Gonioctena quinquepunctata]